MQPRFEKIWNVALTVSQRETICQSIVSYNARGYGALLWHQISTDTREDLIKIDWEFTLGVRFEFDIRDNVRCVR
jgi:hypothetical protein